VVWNQIYANIEAEIRPAVCEIFAYEPDCTDAFSAAGAVWSACYLFLNPKERKVLLFHMREGATDFSPEDAEEEDGDLELRYGYGLF
jgi:hypothetical protein